MQYSRATEILCNSYKHLRDVGCMFANQHQRDMQEMFEAYRASSLNETKLNSLLRDMIFHFYTVNKDNDKFRQYIENNKELLKIAKEEIKKRVVVIHTEPVNE